MRSASILIVVVVLAGCFGSRGDAPSGPPASSDVPTLEPLSELDWSGTGCGEFALFVNRPVSAVRPYVDPRFEIFEAQGQAVVALAVARCADAVIGGEPTNNLVFSDIGVSIQDPEGGREPAYYYFWQATNRELHRENMTRLGLNAVDAPGSNYLTFGLLQATLVQSRIGWPNEAYHASGTGTPQAIASPPPPLVWWHGSENGTMKTDYTVTIQTIGPANGNFSLTPGSLFATIMGTTEVQGDGIMTTFTFAARSERVEV